MLPWMGAIVESFRCNIQIAGPAHCVICNIGLIEPRGVLQLLKHTFLQVRFRVEQPNLVIVELDLEVKVITGAH